MSSKVGYQVKAISTEGRMYLSTECQTVYAIGTAILCVSVILTVIKVVSGQKAKAAQQPSPILNLNPHL